LDDRKDSQPVNPQTFSLGDPTRPTWSNSGIVDQLDGEVVVVDFIFKKQELIVHR